MQTPVFGLCSAPGRLLRSSPLAGPAGLRGFAFGRGFVGAPSAGSGAPLLTPDGAGGPAAPLWYSALVGHSAGGAFWRFPVVPAWFAPPAPGRASRAAVLPGRPPRARAAIQPGCLYLGWSAARALPPGPPLFVVVGLFPAALGCRAAVWGARPLFPWSVSLAGPPLDGHRRPALLGAAFSVAASVPCGSPSFPPAPFPRWGKGGREAGFGAGPVLSRRVRSFGVSAGALVTKGGGPVPRSDLGKTRQGSRYPALGAFRGYQLRYQKLGLDRIERTCYYDRARLVPPLRGPTSWVVRGIGEEKLSFWAASFFALSLRAAAPRFPRVRAARPWAKSPPTPPGFSRLDKPENCQLGFVPMAGNVSNRADTYYPACDWCLLDIEQMRTFPGGISAPYPGQRNKT